MRFINFGIEEEAAQEPVDLDPSETSVAKDVVENAESTEPVKVLKIANYKEELAIIKAQQKDEPAEDGDAGEPAGDEGSEEGAQESTEEGDAESGAEGESEEKPVEDDSEEEADTAKEQAATEQYFQAGHKAALQALESASEMARYHRLIEKRSKLGGISPTTAKVITMALENNSHRCGYYKSAVPALESFSTPSSAARSTKELKVAIEGFLSDVWEAIKRFFKSVWTWISDMLTTKKKTISAKADTPAAREVLVKELKETGDKAVKAVKLKATLVSKDAKRNVTAEAPVKAKVYNKAITDVIFVTGDKGTFQEAFENGKYFTEVTKAFSTMGKEVSKKVNQAGKSVLEGQLCEVDVFKLDKSALGSLEINTRETIGDDSMLVSYTTDPLPGGELANFTLCSTSSQNFFKKNGINASLKSFSKQGCRVVKDTEASERGEIEVPELQEQDFTTYKNIVMVVNEMFNELGQIQKVLGQQSLLIKEIAESPEPSTWAELDKELVSDLRSQLYFCTGVLGNVTMGYVELSNVAGKYVKACTKLLQVHSD